MVCWTTSHAVLTLKLIGITWDVYDGAQKVNHIAQQYKTHKYWYARIAMTDRETAEQVTKEVVRLLRKTSAARKCHFSCKLISFVRSCLRSCLRQNMHTFFPMNFYTLCCVSAKPTVMQEAD